VVSIITSCPIHPSGILCSESEARGLSLSIKSFLLWSLLVQV
jgi:hypothetical protein